MADRWKSCRATISTGLLTYREYPQHPSDVAVPTLGVCTLLTSSVPTREPAFEDLLALRTRAELRAILATTGIRVTLPQAQRLAAHADALEPAVQSLRLAIVHTYTSDLLSPWL